MQACWRRCLARRRFVALRAAALATQSGWRGKRARDIFRVMVKGKRIMDNCETVYLREPTKIVNLCNYMLYLHCIEHKYDKARPLFERAIEFMYQRGPDNAFVLYAYAIFLATVQEEDFDTIMELVRRARAADRTGTAFHLAELGFYKTTAVMNPNDAQAQCNYAIALQFAHRPDYNNAELYYIRAVEADPYDKKIVENFNLMLTNLAGKDYDAFESFRIHQEARAETFNDKWQADVAAKEFSENAVWGAIRIQRVARGYIVRNRLALGLPMLISLEMATEWAEAEDDVLRVESLRVNSVGGR